MGALVIMASTSSACSFPETANTQFTNIDIGGECSTPDSKVSGANMGPTWVLSAPGGPHVGPMNIAIRDMAKSDIDIWAIS